MGENGHLDAGLGQLRQSLAGEVLGPADPGYDEARRCFNANIDRRPAVIARCTGAADIATAFDFARTAGLEVAVRGGGHNPAGHCVLDGGLVIDLSLMREVTVDRDGRTARAQGGATWIDFDSATQAHGLATPGGVVITTGVCGLTLGGGIGHLTAQHGLTCDNLVGAEVVTPGGAVVSASEDENGDLLWGLRGAGGNLGVATSLEFRLHEVDRVVGGLLSYRGDGVRDAVLRYRDVVAGSPTDLSCAAMIELDETGALALELAPCFTGAADDADALATLRAAPGLVGDGLRDHRFIDQQLVIDSPYGERRHYWKSHFVRELSDELVEVLLARIRALGRPPGQILIESLHGAPKTGDAPPGAVGFRQAAFNVTVMSAWLDPELDQVQIDWAREAAAAIEPWAVSGGYVNYMQADEPIERVRAAFGEETFGRLQALKARYDPDNVLRRNQNIPPSA